MKSDKTPMKFHQIPSDPMKSAPLQPAWQILAVTADLHRCGSAKSTKAGGHSCGWDHIGEFLQGFHGLDGDVGGIFMVMYDGF